MKRDIEATGVALFLVANVACLVYAAHRLKVSDSAEILQFAGPLLFLLVVAVLGWNHSWAASNWATEQLERMVLDQKRSAITTSETLVNADAATPTTSAQSSSVPEAQVSESGRSITAQRRSLLKQMADSALAEGDLGRFLLRREPVPGEQAAAFVANFLVSIALFATVLALCIVLSSLADDLPSSAADVGKVFEKLKPTLQRFPQMFLPTAQGLLLAVLLSWRQRRVDSDLEMTWQKLDDDTELRLLPEFIKPRQSEVQSLERLADATKEMAGSADKFKDAGDKLAQLVPTLQSVVAKLNQFDTALLSQKLTDAADAFKDLVDKSEKALSEPATQIVQATNALQQATDQVGTQLVAASTSQAIIQETHGRLADVAEATASAIQGLDDKMLKLADLELTLSTLHGGVNTLERTFADHSQNYLGTIAGIRDSVDGLNKAIDPLLSNVEGVQKHGRQTAGELEKFTHAFHGHSETFTQVLKDYPGHLSQALQEHLQQTRAEHATFQAELSNYFTQGPVLFQRLDALGDRLSSFANEIQQVEGALGSSARELHGNQEQLSVLSESFRAATERLEQIPQLVERVGQSQSHQQADLGKVVAALDKVSNVMLQTMASMEGQLAQLHRQGLPTNGRNQTSVPAGGDAPKRSLVSRLWGGLFKKKDSQLPMPAVPPRVAAKPVKSQPDEPLARSADLTTQPLPESVSTIGSDK